MARKYGTGRYKNLGQTRQETSPNAALYDSLASGHVEDSPNASVYDRLAFGGSEPAITPSVNGKIYEEPKKVPPSLPSFAMPDFSTRPVDTFQKNLPDLIKKASTMDANNAQLMPYKEGIKASDVKSGKVQAPEIKKQIDSAKPYTGTEKGLGDKFAKGLSDATINAVDSAFLGVPLATLPGGKQAKEETNSTAGKVGRMVGELAPVAKGYSLTKGLGKATINQLEKKGLTEAVEQIGINNGIRGASKAAERAIRGGIAGTAYGTAKEAADLAFDTRDNGNESLGQRTKNIGTEVAMFAVGDSAAHLLGRAGKSLLTRNGQQVVKADNTGLVKNATKTDPKTEAALPQAGQPITQPLKTPGLLSAMDETPMRTIDNSNFETANKLIDKHGREGLYSNLLSKKTNLSPDESEAAKMLAKHYASLGGKENLSKSIALISKTAREGREMGQALQALIQWNKLDEGALLLGERQLNRGVSDVTEWRSLTPKQAMPIQESVQRYGQVEEIKNLGDEVLSIVSNKKAGEALTDAEKATIKQFQNQVKTINEKAKRFLPKSKNTTDEMIEKVGKTPPKQRARDQVVDYLEAKAEKARKRLERSRNIGIVAQFDNPVVDYAIIMAAEVAKGIRTYADFSEHLIKQYGKELEPHAKQIYLKSVNIFRKENGLPTTEELDRVVNKAVKENGLDQETADSLRIWVNEIGFIADKNLKVEATQDLQKALKGLGESTLGQKASTFQTGAQLLNLVTIGRNIIGNGSFIVTEKINKVAAVPIDWTLSKLTGERTIQFFPQNQESMWKNFMMGTKSGWDGVSPTGTLASYDIHPEVFGNKNPLKYITKSLGATLQGFDFATYRAAYGDVVATYAEQLGKAQGLTRAQIKQDMTRLISQLDERIHEIADEAGLYATFQDDTMLAQGAQLLKSGLNKITDKPAQMLVERGIIPKKLSTEGFGFGDIVLKYAKTPANLVMRGIDYSPLGFVRATIELAPLFLKRGNFNQFEATRKLSRAITGTLGLTGMGYYLASIGVLTGSSSMDKDERSIQEQSGQGAYKVNWSALGRFITSGFDKEAAKLQEGDLLMDYAWLQPAAISLAMGVNANKAFSERKEGDDTTGWELAEKAILSSLKVVLENPLVQGASDAIGAVEEIIKYQKTDKAKGIVKGVPASFIPTLFNQERTSTDNYQRETADEKLLTEMGNMIKNKLPGLSKTLPVSHDSLGKPRERIQGGEANTISQHLIAFFSPAKMTRYKVSPEAKLVLDLMNESGDKNVLPRIASRSIQVDNPITGKKETIKLTAEQFSKLQKAMGEEVTRRLQLKADYLANPLYTAENKTKVVKNILNKVGEKARNDLRGEMGYKKKETN